MVLRPYFLPLTPSSPHPRHIPLVDVQEESSNHQWYQNSNDHNEVIPSGDPGGLNPIGDEGEQENHQHDPR